jgi:uncharacterized Ntn-hydrolase superfamily protein
MKIIVALTTADDVTAATVGEEIEISNNAEIVTVKVADGLIYATSDTGGTFTVHATKHNMAAALTAEFLADAPEDSKDEVAEVIRDFVAAANAQRGDVERFNDYLNAMLIIAD